MPTQFDVPTYSSSNTEISFGEGEFTFNFRYVKADQSWNMDIYDENDNPLILGVGIRPNRDLTGKYLIDKVLGGNIWCLKVSNTEETLTRDNINIDYQLWYYKVDETPPSDMI